MSLTPRLILALLLAAVPAAAGASTAHAAGPEIGVADDRLLLDGGAGADRVVAEWRAQGVDVVRIFALWSRIAPGPSAARKPASFDAANPTRNSTLRPMAFLRALGCVSSGYRKLRSGDCRRFKPARADGFAFHPHGTLISPDSTYRNRDDVNLASLGRLEAALDRLQRAGRLRPTTRRFNLYLDEYGYQTRPPDRTAGVSLATQDRWLQRAAYRAWRDSRVRLLTQYQWYDEPLRRAGSAFAGWQSGLRFVSGKPKPALAHFDTPMQLDAARSRLWGQARPGGAQTVTVERRPRDATRYGLLARVRTDSRGYWTLKRRLRRGARYRFRTTTAISASIRR